MRAKARFMLTESPAVRTGVEQVLKQDFEGCEQVSPAPDTPKSSGTSAVSEACLCASSSALCPLEVCRAGTGDSPVVCVTASGNRPFRQLGRAAFHRHRLYYWDEVPAVLQFNPYIKSGYRAGVFPCHAA